MEDFFDETSDPNQIPMVIVYYTKEEELTPILWDTMFESLEGYMIGLGQPDPVIHSAVLLSLTELMKEQVEYTQLTKSLTLIRRMIETKDFLFTKSMTMLVLRALDESFPQFGGSIELINLSKEVIHLMLTSYMKDMELGLDPVEFE